MKTKNGLVPAENGLMPAIEDGRVDARSLHERLGIGTQFSMWFQRRIEEFGFQENEDWYSNLGTTPAGHQITEYSLTLDMAKELAMVERSKIGQKIRRYFIECEKELVRRSEVRQPSTAIGKLEMALVDGSRELFGRGRSGPLARGRGGGGSGLAGLPYPGTIGLGPPAKVTWSQ